MALDYSKVGKAGEYDATKDISSQVSEVTDVAHLSGWERRERSSGGTEFVRSEPGKPPLKIMVSEDRDLIKLYTTAYGEEEFQGGMHKLARKAFADKGVAMGWLERHFDL